MCTPIITILATLLAVHVFAQTPLEKQFLAIPSAARAYENLAYLTSLPHPAGTIEERHTAQYVLDMLTEFGLNAHIEQEDVLVSYPRNFSAKSRVLEVISPTPYTATLQEPLVPIDPTSGDDRTVPPFHGYAPSGDVTGQLVYVNFGRLEDYATLDSLGISVQGRIVIARYGAIFRGIIVWLAQLHGAIGCIIYSDPHEDGFTRGKTYPEGPWRPQWGVQRGSVQFLSLCPGDPTNPLCTGNVTDHIPAIPSIPISWGDALPLLSQLGGPTINDWQGGLPITYKIGPGPCTVHLKLDIEFKTTPIWNVIADIPGDSDDLIILGNHRDAWTFGATDPNSGTATLLEVARAFGILSKSGWKPKRTIRLCSWDGEEFGLLGSTAYADRHASLLSQRAVAYLNVDVAVTGRNFSASGTHTLNKLLRDVAEIITDPISGEPLSELWDENIGTLGSGSDYTAFLDRYGISSVDMQFSGPYGVYHSTYDSMYWMKSFGDPEFLYHRTLAQFWGVLALRLSESDILPLNFTEEAVALQQYFGNAQDLLKEYNGTGKVDITRISTAITDFTNAAKILHEKISGVTDKNSQKMISDQLFLVEREFLGPGLPKRPYYRHVIQAPGLYKGYGSEVFPGVEQEITEQNWAQTQIEIITLANRIEAAAAVLASIAIQ